MLDGISYQTLLGLHLLAVVAFLAGFLLVATMLPSLTASAAADREQLAGLRRLNRFATTPALVILWMCGIAMALKVGWYVAGWFQIKVALVAGLSLQHLRQTGTLGRLARGRPVRPARYRMLGLIAITVVAIATLVIAKPG